jgi:phage terminase large subunit GpA-like protein
VAFLEVLHKVANASARIATPPPLLTVADWADEYLFLSPEDSAEAGKYRTDRAPYQREMLEVVSDPNIKEVVYCTSSQIGKTLLSKCIIGYHIHQDPGPIIVMQPTVKIAETFSKDRLSPMVRDTPVLKRLIADPKSRSSGNTIDHKTFPGGHITMIGANAPSDLASRPIRIVFADEVDRYPVSAGSEGDPLFLARQRSVTFWNRKFVMASTPTMEGASRIWREFERSDMRYFYLPCPHCGEFHTLKWPQIVWDEGDASSARAVCPECGSIYENADKLKMLAAGEWRAHNQNPRVAGFHISALYSPWQTFADVVQEFLDKKDHPETLKTFINLQLGECFEDRTGEKIDQSGLMARREQWDHVPEDVVLITAGVDVQGDRLEVSIIGYTAKDQSRVLHHLRLYGNPGEPKIWQTLDDLLLQPLMTETGALMSIRAACIDSGGHHTQEVYKFCGERAGRRVMAIKGRAGALPIWPTKLSRKKLKHGASLHIIGVDTAKDVIHSSLSVLDPDLPKYVAFSAGLPDDYFPQLVAERRVPKVNKSGFTTRTWVKKSGDRNEALDCFVYALAALKMLESMKPNLLRFARPQYSAPKPKATPDAETAPPRPPATRRTSSAIL